MGDKPSIRIVSDGQGNNTTVYNENGTEIHWVTGVDLELRAGLPNKATVYVVRVNGEINAEVEAIKERIVPAPQSVLVFRVSEAEFVPRGCFDSGRASRIRIERHKNRGTDHTEVSLVGEGWVEGCEPFELVVPEES